MVKSLFLERRWLSLVGVALLALALGVCPGAAVHALEGQPLAVADCAPGLWQRPPSFNWEVARLTGVLPRCTPEGPSLPEPRWGLPQQASQAAAGDPRALPRLTPGAAAPEPRDFSWALLWGSLGLLSLGLGGIRDACSWGSTGVNRAFLGTGVALLGLAGANYFRSGQDGPGAGAEPALPALPALPATPAVAEQGWAAENPLQNSLGQPRDALDLYQSAPPGMLSWDLYQALGPQLKGQPREMRGRFLRDLHVIAATEAQFVYHHEGLGLPPRSPDALREAVHPRATQLCAALAAPQPLTPAQFALLDCTYIALEPVVRIARAVPQTKQELDFRGRVLSLGPGNKTSSNVNFKGHAIATVAEMLRRELAKAPPEERKSFLERCPSPIRSTKSNFP